MLSGRGWVNAQGFKLLVYAICGCRFTSFQLFWRSLVEEPCLVSCAITTPVARYIVIQHTLIILPKMTSNKVAK
ncbi:hypothetical protein [Nostoc sp. CCY 9925]|uniref:hypothetical protein n=1 Tax=Nostoc sp. CCY 9925 TaxID=3103865 RepID=UPI0039C5C900